MSKSALDIIEGSRPDPRPEYLLKLEFDKKAAYYPFLYLLSLFIKPSLVVELGTGRTAISAMHLALASPEAKVITIDTSSVDLPTGYPNNLEVLRGHSVSLAEKISDGIDILFIDTDHTYDTTTKELSLYVPKVKPGGVVLMDDIHLGQDMEKVWQVIPEPKLDLPLHSHCGFGAFVVTGSTKFDMLDRAPGA